MKLFCNSAKSSARQVRPSIRPGLRGVLGLLGFMFVAACSSATPTVPTVGSESIAVASSTALASSTAATSSGAMAPASASTPTSEPTELEVVALAGEAEPEARWIGEWSASEPEKPKHRVRRTPLLTNRDVVCVESDDSKVALHVNEQARLRLAAATNAHLALVTAHKLLAHGSVQETGSEKWFFSNLIVPIEAQALARGFAKCPEPLRFLSRVRAPR
jgi:hypothetical protein